MCNSLLPATLLREYDLEKNIFSISHAKSVMYKSELSCPWTDGAKIIKRDFISIFASRRNFSLIYLVGTTNNLN